VEGYWKLVHGSVIGQSEELVQQLNLFSIAALFLMPLLSIDFRISTCNSFPSRYLNVAA
jgi:hypothetical protein